MIYFDGRPDVRLLKPGQIGINRAWLEELKKNRPKKNKNFIPILEEILKDPQPDLLTVPREVLASRLSLDPSTVGRAKKRLEDHGVLYRVHLNGGYAVSPELMIVVDDKGEQMQPPDPFYRKVKFKRRK